MHSTIEPLLTIKAAAVHLDVSAETIRRMIARGELKARRYGRSIRINPRDLARAGRPVTSIAEVFGGDAA